VEKATDKGSGSGYADHLGERVRLGILEAATDANRTSSELGLDWLATLAEMTRGAALLMLGRTTDGRQALHAAIRGTRASDWAAALSELMLAQNLLASGDPARHAIRQAAELAQAELGVNLGGTRS